SLTFLATSSGLIFSSGSLRLRSSDDDIRLFHINKDMLKKIKGNCYCRRKSLIMTNGSIDMNDTQDKVSGATVPFLSRIYYASTTSSPFNASSLIG
ncbi:MAG: hypothetical protein WA667_18945, partial [Candidatus Nitrosopolaris sp.]